MCNQILEISFHYLFDLRANPPLTNCRGSFLLSLFTKILNSFKAGTEYVAKLIKHLSEFSS